MQALGRLGGAVRFLCLVGPSSQLKDNTTYSQLFGHGSLLVQPLLHFQQRILDENARTEDVGGEDRSHRCLPS